MRTRPTIFVLVILGAWLVAGCAPSDDDAGAASTEAASTEAASVSTAPAPRHRIDPGIPRYLEKEELPTVVPYLDDDGSWWLGEGVPMYAETFAFDPSAGRAFPSQGPELSGAGVPVPMRITSFNFTSYGGGASAVYANVRFDISRAREDAESLPLGVVVVDDQNKQWPRILFGSHQSFVLDANYVLFPGSLTAVKAGGPFVTLRAEVVAGAGDDVEPVAGVSVATLRQGTSAEGPVKTGEDGIGVLNLEAVEEPAIVVRAALASDTTETIVPLPIKGADEGILSQTVRLRMGSGATD